MHNVVYFTIVLHKVECLSVLVCPRVDANPLSSGSNHSIRDSILYVLFRWGTYIFYIYSVLFCKVTVYIFILYSSGIVYMYIVYIVGTVVQFTLNSLYLLSVHCTANICTVHCTVYKLPLPKICTTKNIRTLERWSGSI